MNNLSDLRDALYKEHFRDRRLTIISYTLLLIVVALVLGLLLYFGANLGRFASSFFDSGESDGSAAGIYRKLIPFIIIVMVIGYPVLKFWKIIKRPKKIEALLSQLQKGEKPTGINEITEYKITVPVFKTNVKMCPVTFVHIYLGNSPTPYILPISNRYIADVKTLLSGANVDEISKLKNLIYGEGIDYADVQERNFTPTSIKSVDEFRAFIDKEMKGDLIALETSRKSMNKSVIISIVFAIVFIVGIVGYNMMNVLSATKSDDISQISNPSSSFIPIVIVFLVVSVIFNLVIRRKAKQNTDQAPLGFDNNTLKEKVVERMIHFINPSLQYSAIGHLGINDIYKSGLFDQKNYKVQGCDMISGFHSGVPFISCDLSMYHKRNMTEEKEAPDCAFSGRLFVARFNKRFSAPVYVIPQKNNFNTGLYLTSEMGEVVRLEDPEFMKKFKVYSTDQVTARYILTPSLMERIKELEVRTAGVYNIAFYNNMISIANNTGKYAFGFDRSRSITKDDNQLLIDFYNNLCNQFSIIDELKLNINIWR